MTIVGDGVTSWLGDPPACDHLPKLGVSYIFLTKDTIQALLGSTL